MAPRDPASIAQRQLALAAWSLARAHPDFESFETHFSLYARRLELRITIRHVATLELHEELNRVEKLIAEREHDFHGD